MRNFFLGIQIQLPALLFLLAASSCASGDDRFAIAVGPRDTLFIFAPNGDQAAALAVPSISKPVKIGDTTFEVSYGRDANDLLTVILTPDPTEPKNLHFNVLRKNVDTDQQAVVTLTFSSNLNHVAVDPGYLGIVQVDSHTLRRHSLSDESYPAAPVSSAAPLVARASPELAPRNVPSPSSGSTASASAYNPMIPAPVSNVQPQAQASTSEARTSAMSTAPVPLTPPMLSSPASSTAFSPSSSPENPAEQYAMQGAHPGTYPPTNTPGIPLQVPMATKSDVTRFYWSEPVTPPNGHPPPIAIDEMKLVDVQGTVTVGMPDGATKTGENGMVIPSGATVKTDDKASSAAIFVGGVDSARLLPGTNVSITHNLDGAVRHTKIDLREGTVFSRVGRRAGEKEDYSVSTPEGIAAARGTDFAVCCRQDGSGHDPIYVYVMKGVVTVSVNGNIVMTLTGNGSQVGMGSVPPAQDEKTVLMEILQALQQFNIYINEILQKLNGGPGPLTAADILYYNEQLAHSFYLVDENNRLIVGPNGITTPYDFLTMQQLSGIIPPVLEFNKTPPVTPY
ncbi:MAG: FecR domain-containing protein [Methylacidiphilales bacterium]|nr:FecR domain-containing protein [Candidatus Methylacidiphilales bacterium]